MADHGHSIPAADSPADVTLHERTFGAFVRFWVYVFGAAACVLIFLAIFNS